MKSLMRLFVAIEPDEPAIRHLQRMQESLRPILSARWIPPQQLHVTLKFLGQTTDEQLPQLLSALKLIQMRDPIHLGIAGVVCFPPHGPVRIIAAALADEQNRGSKLAAEIDQACHKVGFPLEKGRWTPHITLARVKSRTGPDIRRQISAIATPPFDFDADQFLLKESRLSAQGPSYTTLATFG